MRLALGLVAALVLTAAPGVAHASADRCGAAAAWGANCDVSNQGDSVDIGAAISTPGAGGSSGPPNNGGMNVAEEGADEAEQECEGLCRPMDFYVELIPEVTVEDLASFAPTAPAFTGEPSGVAVVGMPANLYASASAQQLAGELFDYDVIVQFVPAGYRFDYGDGTVVTVDGGGASWEALGQAEFTPTPTSHIYASRGTYTASVTALYRASVDFGIGGWFPVPGFVEAGSGGYLVRAVEVHTALVDRTCAEDPSGPGC